MSRAVGAIVFAVAGVAVGAGGGGWAFGYGPFAHHGAAGAAASQVPVSTAVVTRGTLAVSEDDAGTVGYSGFITIYTAMSGTVTWLPADRSVIRPGQRVFAVDGQDVVLMRGGTPAWRAFTPGMTSGADVAELQRSLIAQGYDPYHAITIDGSYDWATQAAVQRWQAARGWLADGQIALGQVVFAPGPVRAAASLTGAGATVAAGAPVLTVTSTTPVVTVSLSAGEESAVGPGQHVTITLPDGTATAGRVLSVSGPAASSPAAAGAPSGSGSSSSAGNTGAGNAGATPATVNVAVSFDHPVTGLDGAPVQVSIATQTQRDALIVPISALLAKPGGGYQVTVVGGSARYDVTVTPGLFDDIGGNVAVTGPGIAAGTRVEVPSS